MISKKTAKKQVSIHIRCDEKLASDFKHEVEKYGYSQSLIIRELMKAYIEKKETLNLLK